MKRPNSHALYRLVPSVVRTAIVGLALASASCSGDSTDPLPAGQSPTTINIVPVADTLVGVGASRQLEVSGIPSSSVTWSSSDELVVRVDPGGVVTAVGNGDAVITATAGNAAAHVAIAVVFPVPSLSVGSQHTCGVSDEFMTYCWGRNDFGQLGDGSTTDATLPVLVDGGLTFREVHAGIDHTCGVTPGGEVYCWGRGGSGRLGDGQDAISATPVLVSGRHEFTAVAGGHLHTCALTSSGEAYCWGSNRWGELGAGASVQLDTCDEAGIGIIPCSLAPVRVASSVAFIEIVVGDAYSCALGTDRVAYCWGLDTGERLGGRASDSCTSGTTTAPCALAPIRNGGPYRFESLGASAVGSHTCGVLADRRVFCWGSNSHGQLGNGTNVSSGIPVDAERDVKFLSVAPGRLHTCALAVTRSIYCWGSGLHGRLGSATQVDFWVPVLVVGRHEFVWASAGSNHSCGVTLDGAGFCWGLNASGELGDGSHTMSLIPVALGKNVGLRN